MDIKDVSPQRPGTEYPFGVDNAEIATVLRRLADRIESGESLVQTVRLLGLATSEAFILETLRIAFVTKVGAKA